MKLRCWHLFAYALGLACGPGTADDTAAGSTSMGGSTTTTDTPTIDPGTDPTAIPTTGDPTGATTGPAVCFSEEFLFPVVTVEIMLVLERSSSMLRLWDHDRDDLDDDGVVDGGVDPATAKVTRWSSVHRSLAPALVKSAGSYQYGAHLFPAAGAAAPPDDSACSVDPAPLLPPAQRNADELLAALPPEDALDLGGASPTAAALTTAIAALGPADGDLRVLIYVGDGAPNCADGASGDQRFEALDPATTALLSAAIADDVQVRILGVEASAEPAPSVVDGEPDGVAPAAFFAMQAEFGALADNEFELDSLLGGWLDTPEGGTCFLELSHPEWTIDRLEYDGKPVPLVDDCASEDGWQNTGPGQIELCNAVCDAFNKTGGPLTVFYTDCP